MRQIERLTFREYEVAYLVYQGWNNQGIADYLFLSIRTIESHIFFIFKKLAISTRVEVVRFFKFKGVPDYGDMKRPRKPYERCSKLYTYNSEAYSLKVWASKRDMNFYTLYSRVCRLNWDMNKALNTPVRGSKY